jgi:hypothetical protein
MLEFLLACKSTIPREKMKSFHRAAATIVVAAVATLASTSASALCSISTPTPTSTVTPAAGTSYDYQYTVTGVSGSCVAFYGPERYVVDAFELPYFADAGVTAIQSPTGWTARVVADDTFNLGHGAETLVWTADASSGIQPGNNADVLAQTLAGFGYTANYSSAYAPGGIQIQSGNFTIVDPALPASPAALEAGLQPTTFPTASSVPEPSIAFSMIAGLACLTLVRRRTR